MVMAKGLTELPRPSIKTIFLGMKVGRKLGSAVIRNKIKRRIRHLVQILSKDPSFPCDNTGIIIIPRKGFDKVLFSTLLSELNKLFH
jgi:ribonuclease P protein component